MFSRTFQRIILSGAMVVMLAAGILDAADNLPIRTFTYKTVGDLEIKADVERPNDQELRPVVVWIHGGALIMGHRAAVPTEVQEWVHKKGYVLVSIDYRLAPETKLPEILSDVEDAFRWIRERGPELFHADTARMAVVGASAGGYLTLTTGFRVQPRPTVLVAIYGYGDLIGDWQLVPSTQARHQHNMMSEAEVRKQVNEAPLADSRNRKGDGYGFYYFTRRQGSWPKVVSGWDPRAEPERFFPYMPVKNVTPEYPPTVMIHGTADTDVPFAQSELMAEQFRMHGVPYKLLSVPNGEHGFGGGDRQVIEDAYREAFEFAETYLH